MTTAGLLVQLTSKTASGVMNWMRAEACAVLLKADTQTVMMLAHHAET